jgi:hypothetical protein
VDENGPQDNDVIFLSGLDFLELKSFLGQSVAIKQQAFIQEEKDDPFR